MTTSTSTSTTTAFRPGDRVHFNGWTDVTPGTVVKASAKRVTVRQDTFTRDPEWTPDLIPGGFSAHCTNNYQQRNIISEDPTGRLITFSLINAPKHIRDYHAGETLEARWVQKGGSWQRGPFLREGWAAFHDYNF